jgi:hypothetical protein
VRRATPRGTSSLLGYLQRAGAAPAPAVIGTDVGGREALVTEFAWFLRTECGLAETTIDWYRHVAAMFLAAQVGDVTDMAVLSARQVNAFVLAQIGRRGTGSLNNVVTALRALLRFFYLRGYTATPLAGAPHRGVAGQGSVARARRRAGGAAVGRLRPAHQQRAPRLRHLDRARPAGAARE